MPGVPGLWRGFSRRPDADRHVNSLTSLIWARSFDRADSQTADEWKKDAVEPELLTEDDIANIEREIVDRRGFRDFGGVHIRSISAPPRAVVSRLAS